MVRDGLAFVYSNIVLDGTQTQDFRSSEINKQAMKTEGLKISTNDIPECIVNPKLFCIVHTEYKTNKENIRNKYYTKTQK